MNFTEEQQKKITKGLCVIPRCSSPARPGRHVCVQHTQKMHRFRKAYNYVYPVYMRLCERNGLVPLNEDIFKQEHNKQNGLYPPYL